MAIISRGEIWCLCVQKAHQYLHQLQLKGRVSILPSSKKTKLLCFEIIFSVFNGSGVVMYLEVIYCFDVVFEKMTDELQNILISYVYNFMTLITSAPKDLLFGLEITHTEGLDFYTTI